MKKLAHYCLAHPCWSGVSGIVAIVTLLGAARWPWNLSAMIQSANEKGPSISSLLPEFGSSRSNTKPRELPDLSGKWEVSTEITSSTYTAYHGLVMHYDVGVSQTGNIIQMAGEKDGEREPDSVRVVYEGKARTTILGEGEIAIGEGGLASIAISSEENGTKRRIKTVFVLTEVESGLLQGTFRSEAAATTGTCTWTKLP